MSHTINRRDFARGAAWSAPIVLATASVPAYAASFCSTAQKSFIDAAFTAVRTNALTAYWTEPAAGSLDGISKMVWFNIINNSQYNIVLADPNGLKIQFEAVYANGTKTLPTGPTGSLTSWGTTSPTTTGTTGTQQSRVWTWTANGTTMLSSAKGNDNIVDMSFSTGTNSGGIKVLATLVQAPIIYPDFDSVQKAYGSDLSGCRDYYNQKVASQAAATITMAGPLLGGSQALWYNDGNRNTLPGGSIAWNVGTALWSNQVGNYISDVYPPRIANVAAYSNGIY